MNRPTAPTVVLASAVAALVLTGCSQSSDVEPATTDDATTPLEDAAAFWQETERLGNGDATCDLGRDAFTAILVSEGVVDDPTVAEEYAAWGAIAYCDSWMD